MINVCKKKRFYKLQKNDINPTLSYLNIICSTTMLLKKKKNVFYNYI